MLIIDDYHYSDLLVLVIKVKHITFLVNSLGN
jgi:hypothetical protein